MIVRFEPGLRLVLKHGSHDQSAHGNWASGSQSLRNQDGPMDPETAWVHNTTWYHGTSRPDLVTLDARNAPSRYPGMGSSYSLMAHNFATNDRELAAQYARDAVDMDMENGITGARAVVYEVKPTSDYFDPDPHSGPGGWNDGPEDMSVARELVEGGGGVSIRFHDEMDIVGAFDAETGESITVQKMAEMLKHGSHDQASHGNWASGSGTLPEGWAARPKESLTTQYAKQAEEEWGYDPGRAASLGARRAAEVDVYDGPNGSQIVVEKGVVSQDDVASLAQNVSDMQVFAPNAGMTVTVGNRPFTENGRNPDEVYGFARLGKPEIALAPRVVSDGVRVAEVSHVMPSAASNPKKYALAHEWGHTIDQRSPDRAFKDSIVMGQSEYRNSMSVYGMSDGGRYEPFAEAFAHYTLTGGDASRPAVAYFAETYNWNAGGGIPVAKAAELEDIIIFDTFSPETEPTTEAYVERDPFAPYVAELEKAVSVVKFQPGLRPVLKHGDHDQAAHGNWAKGREDAIAQSATTGEPTGITRSDLEAIRERPGDFGIVYDPAADDPDLRRMGFMPSEELAVRKKVNAIEEGFLRREGKEETARGRLAEMDSVELKNRAEMFDLLEKEGTVMVAADESAAIGVLQEGRFKSVFETNTSNGAVAFDARRSEEFATLDLHPGLDESIRPSYGYMALENMTPRGVSQYGEIRFELKPEVKERTTMTNGDSLGSRATPVPVVGPRTPFQVAGAEGYGPVGQYYDFAESTSPRDIFTDGSGRSYVETQIRGGVSVSDIARVHVAAPSDSLWDRGALETAAAARGIEVVYSYDY